MNATKAPERSNQTQPKTPANRFEAGALLLAPWYCAAEVRVCTVSAVDFLPDAHTTPCRTDTSENGWCTENGPKPLEWSVQAGCQRRLTRTQLGGARTAARRCELHRQSAP